MKKLLVFGLLVVIGTGCDVPSVKQAQLSPDADTEEQQSVPAAQSEKPEKPIPPAEQSEKPEKPIAPAGDFIIEAEQYTTNQKQGKHSWIRVPAKDGSPEHMDSAPRANVVVKASTEELQQKSPELRYELEFKSAGRYYVWVRGKGEAGGATIAVGLNGALLKENAAIGYFPYKFAWLGRYIKGERVVLDIPSPGKHTLNFWMREDGFRFDKFAITQNPQHVPQ